MVLYVGRMWVGQRFCIVDVCNSGTSTINLFSYVDADDILDESDSAQWKRFPWLQKAA